MGWPGGGNGDETRRDGAGLKWGTRPAAGADGDEALPESAPPGVAGEDGTQEATAGSEDSAAVSEATAETDAAGEAATSTPTAPPGRRGWGAGEAAAEAGITHWRQDARSDDPDAREVLPPLGEGIGSGRAFHFLFGFKRASPTDQEMLEMEREAIAPHIAVLRQHGYTVVVDRQATRQELLEAVSGRGEGVADLAPAAIYWSAHGLSDGGIECCDGARVLPADLEEVETHPGLRLLILAACYSGRWSRRWRAALGGGPLVVGWGRPVTIGRAVEFLKEDPETETDLDDLIRRYLLADTPLPGDTVSRFSPRDAAAQQGRKENLAVRVERVAELLGAAWREQERWLELRVPVPEDRTQIGRVFVVDSAAPFNEGEPLLAVESEVGELSAVVDPNLLLAGLDPTGYAQVALVKSDADMPTIVTRGVLPLGRVRDKDLAALVYQVCAWADVLERRIFGGDFQ